MVFTWPKKSIKNEVPRPKKTRFLLHFWSIFGGTFRGHMTASWHCFGRSKRGKVLILPARGAENHPPRKAPQDTPTASLFGPSWGAQAAPWGTKKGPKKWPGTGVKFAKKSSQIGPQRVPQGPCLGRAGRARLGPARPAPGPARQASLAWAWAWPAGPGRSLGTPSGDLFGMTFGRIGSWLWAASGNG